jgi:hypothetical protein
MNVARAALQLALVTSLVSRMEVCSRGGPIDFSGPSVTQMSTLKVSIRNATSAGIQVSYGGFLLRLPAGERAQLALYSSALPKGETMDTTIVIEEPSPGQFTATASEPDWIRIVSVTRI